MSGVISTPDMTTLGLQDNNREKVIKAGHKGNAQQATREEKVARLKEIRKACAGMEAVFVGSLIKAMRQSIPDSSLLPSHPGSDIYEGLMDEKLADFLTDKVGTGMGQILFNQMVHREGLDDVAETEAVNLGIKYEKMIPAGYVKRDSIWDSQVMNPVNRDQSGKNLPHQAEKKDVEDDGTEEPGGIIEGMNDGNTG